jgi:hypothetical protein
LEEIVFSPAKRLPGFPIVDTDLERFDRDVRVDNLYAEPVFGGATLGFQEQRTADVALDDLPLHVDSADFEVRQLLEAAGEQINIVQSTSSRTLVDNLMHKWRTQYVRIKIDNEFQSSGNILYSP